MKDEDPFEMSPTAAGGGLRKRLKQKRKETKVSLTVFHFKEKGKSHRDVNALTYP